MMILGGVGSSMGNNHCTRKVLGVVCIKVMSFVQLLDDWKKQVRPWNMERIMKDIGLGNFSLSR